MHTARPGEIFRPRFLAAGIWLQLDNFAGGPLYQDLLDEDLVETAGANEGASDSNLVPCAGGTCQNKQEDSGCYCNAPCSKACGHEGEHRCAECLRRPLYTSPSPRD